VKRPFSFLLLFFLFIKSQGFSQNTIDLENWNPGYIITKEEDTIYGPVIINYGTDLVQINEENTVKTFGANQIQRVYIKEKDRDIERYIYSFQFHPYSDFKPYKLFEILFSGKSVCLLSREMLITETVPIYDNFTYRTYYTTRTRLSADFFLMFPGEKVKALSGSKKELLLMLADKKDQIKKYIQDNKLSVSEKEDLSLIIKEYNILKVQK
jgi:hypothetical protein